MQISKSEWDSILKYIKNRLLVNSYPIKRTMGMTDDLTITTEMVSCDAITGVMEKMNLEQFLADSGNKKERKKVVIDSDYKEAWEKFWTLWPGTKSVPGTAFKSGAKMKGNEEKMYQKWLEGIKIIPAERMYYAAKCFLEWGYEDSKRTGRNELISRNGMEPWMNQKLYLIYKDKEMPETKKERKIYQNAVDQ